MAEKMEYGRIPGLDKPLSRLVQGTAMIDGSEVEQEFALLDAVVELGCTTFDTAHVYGNGANERAVGRWVRERNLRNKVTIIAKGAHHNADRKRVTPFDITADLHDSLARLQFEHVDLYLLHRDDESVPVDGIVDVLNKHLDEGRIRAFGGSNWSYQRIQAANAYAEKNGLTPFAASSPNFSLAEQVKEPWAGCVSIGGERGKAARRYYQETKLPLFTWSSLAGGFFSGRFRRDNLDSFEDYYDKLCVESYGVEENFERLDRAEQLANEKGLSLPQIALSYVLSQPLDIYALVGCRTRQEFADNVEAASVALSEKEVRWLESGT